MNPKSLEGVIIADLLVSYASPQQKEECEDKIISYLSELLVRTEISNKEYGFFNLFLSNVSRAEEILSWINEQPGITGARMDLVRDRIELYELFFGKLDKKVLGNDTLSIKEAPELI